MQGLRQQNITIVAPHEIYVKHWEEWIEYEAILARQSEGYACALRFLTTNFLLFKTLTWARGALVAPELNNFTICRRCIRRRYSGTGDGRAKEGIGNNPTFDAADTSQPACSFYVVGVSQVHSSGDPMPNVDTPGLLVDVVGAHTMAPPNDRIPDTGVSGIKNNSVDNNLPTHVGSSVRQSVPS
ncbi:hypothetical protein Tco_1160697, partial [Tanacetum coccineum]